MEASTLQATAVRPRSGPSIGASLLRLRSDEQLVALFRAGSDEAFRAIHDRYRQRLFAYARQMLPGRQDAEDALQDVFVRAYAGLRANDRQIALRAWLYRVAHNRCVDELRRPLVSPAEVFELISIPEQDPVAQADQRESLRRLIADVRRLPQQQRSALLMRELSGMSYAELAVTLETTVPAVKSLLVRARMALALAVEARETSCVEIREELVLAQDRRVRPGAMVKRHMRDCPGCRDFRRDLRGVSRNLAALTPALGPLGVAAKVLGFGFGGGAGGGAAMSGGVAGGSAAGTVVGSGGVLASAGALATGAGHVATLIVATVVTAGGAVEIQQSIAHAPAPIHHRAHHAAARPAPAAAILTVGDPIAVPASAEYASEPYSPGPVLQTAVSTSPVAAPAPARLAAPPAAKKTHATKPSTPTSTPKAPGSDGSSSTTSTGTGAPTVGSTSTTGTGPTGPGASGSSTATATGTAPASGSQSSGTPGTAAQGTSESSPGTSSTGSPAASSAGAGSGQAGTTPTSS